MSSITSVSSRMLLRRFRAASQPLPLPLPLQSSQTSVPICLSNAKSGTTPLTLYRGFVVSGSTLSSSFFTGANTRFDNTGAASSGSTIGIRTKTRPIPRLRSISSIILPRCPTRLRLLRFHPSMSGSRCFSSSIPRGGPRYRRFGDGGGGGGWYRESIFVKLLYAAKPHHFVILGLVLGGLYICGSETVEMTGRRRFNCISHERELNVGNQSYNEILRLDRGKILPESHPLTVMVKRVLGRLIPFAPIDGADWKVHVIRDDGMANAFVLPGGKVFVYTGVLPVCGDEDGLAAVLGHEVAHVVAHHPGESMSNNIITLGVVFLISVLFDVSGQLPSLGLNLVYGLPNSRTQEAEADDMGLMMMSKACFNPEAAVKLWSRMQKAEQVTPPQFLSTHPASYNRMEAIRKLLPKARAIYEDSGCYSIGNFMPGFKQVYNSFGW